MKATPIWFVGAGLAFSAFRRMTIIHRRCLGAWVLFLVLLVGGCGEDKSTDPSRPSWEVTGLSDGDVLALTIDNVGTIYASVNEDGIYRTTDSGVTWSKQKTGPFVGAGTGYAQCLLTHGYSLWAGTDTAGIYRSTDEGVTWVETPEGGAPIGEIFSLSVASERVFCCSENGIFVFVEGGQWTQVGTHKAFALCEGDATIYAGGQYPLGGGAILWGGGAGGGTWYMTGVGGERVSCFAPTPDGTVFAGGYRTGVLRHPAHSGWTVWEAVGQGEEPGSIIDDIVTAPSGGVFVSTGNQVYRSLDSGVSWVWVSEGLTGGRVYGLAVDAAGYLFAGTGAGVFRATL